MFLKKLVLNLLFFTVFVIVLGLFIYNLNGNSFTNIYNYIFTTIHCDALEEFKDQLIILQSFQDYLVIPCDGYDIENKDVFLDMFDNKSGKLGYIRCSDAPAGQYFIEVNNKTYSVHPYLVDIIFERFGINK